MAVRVGLNDVLNLSTHNESQAVITQASQCFQKIVWEAIDDARYNLS